MIQFSTAPWAANVATAGNETVTDCNGEIIVSLVASHLTNEECSTIVRAIASLPLIMDLLNTVIKQADELNQLVVDGIFFPGTFWPLAMELRMLAAYIAPVEHSAEVATNRWLHAVNASDGTPEAEAALRQLTLSLSDTLNGDLSHYPQPVQDAFAHAMSLLTLAKHMPVDAPDFAPLFTTPQVHIVNPADYANHPAVTNHYKKHNGL